MESDFPKSLSRTTKARKHQAFWLNVVCALMDLSFCVSTSPYAGYFQPTSSFVPRRPSPRLRQASFFKTHFPANQSTSLYPKRILRYIFHTITAGKLTAIYNEVKIPTAPPTTINITIPILPISLSTPFPL